jgi:transcriptional regulator with XRE-family HTH domain
MPLRTTPNQHVAYNLRRARNRRRWTQEEAAERLAPYLGTRWSKASYSAAERSADGVRVRQFSADDLYAFARCFELPVSFFLAPSNVRDVEIGSPNASETVSREQAFELCFGLPDAAQDYLLGEILELSAPTTQALVRWRDQWASVAAKRQRFIDTLYVGREDAQSAEGGD